MGGGERRRHLDAQLRDQAGRQTLEGGPESHSGPTGGGEEGPGLGRGADEMTPWDSSDAERHTKKANTAGKKRQWTHVANSALDSGDSEASAIRQANAVIKRRKRKKKSWGDAL